MTIQNANAGHYVPTGDSERFILGIVKLLDKKGEQLQQEEFRIGHTWLWNPTRKVGNNRLRQGEEVIWDVKFVNQKQSNPTKLVVIFYHVRLSTETAEHIRSANNVDESLLENGTDYVQNIASHYPFASLIFKVEIDLTNFSRRNYSTPELILLSKLERENPFHPEITDPLLFQTFRELVEAQSRIHKPY